MDVIIFPTAWTFNWFELSSVSKMAPDKFGPKKERASWTDHGGVSE